LFSLLSYSPVSFFSSSKIPTKPSWLSMFFIDEIFLFNFFECFYLLDFIFFGSFNWFYFFIFILWWSSCISLMFVRDPQAFVNRIVANHGTYLSNVFVTPIWNFITWSLFRPTFIKLSFNIENLNKSWF
jgi:hypothetical protein